MFSLDRFNQARFSLGNTQNVVAVEVMFAENMNSVAGAAIPVESTAFFDAGLRGTSRGTIAVRSAFNSASKLLAACEMRANILVGARMPAELKQVARGVKNILRGGDFADALTAYGYPSKNIIWAEAEADVLNAATNGVKNIPAVELGASILTAVAGAIKQSTEQVTIRIAVPPGGELRIDSDTFRVMLNGENILYAQSGDWIRISRELLYLDIESAAGGGLQGNMIYTERFL